MQVDLLGGPVNCTTQNIPCVFTHKQDGPTPGTFVSALQGNSIGNNNGPVGSTVLQNGPAFGGQTANLKGRLVFNPGFLGSINTGCVITVNDSNPFKTLADANHRPTMDSTDVNDVCIGYDQGSVGSASANMAFMAPVGYNFYVGSTFNGTSWKEQLTSSLKTFRVPITTNSQLTSTLATGTAPFSITSTTPVSNLTLTAHPQVYEAGLLTTGEKIYTNKQTLSGGNTTHTFANGFSFTSASTFGCSCTDQTSASACRAVPASATTVTLVGTGSDVLWLSCSGH